MWPTLVHALLLMLVDGLRLSARDALRPRPRPLIAMSVDESWTAPRPIIAISTEFAQLCQAQFELLSATVGAARCAVYFRRENPFTGALEFVPVAVYPQAQSVWVVGQNGELPTVGPRELPGCTSAPTLIPNYPFVQRDVVGSADGGGGCDDPSSDECGLRLPDGGFSFPLLVDGVVVGVLTFWRSASAAGSDGDGGAAGDGGARAKNGTVSSDASRASAAGAGPDQAGRSGGDGRAQRPQRQRRLSRAQCDAAMAVARSLALSTMLDQRLIWSGIGASRSTRRDALASEMILNQVGASLQTSLHQLASPLSALRLFSKLLLRKLPADDGASRQLVREMVAQAMRGQELLGPLQALASQLPAPRASAQPQSQQQQQQQERAQELAQPGSSVLAEAQHLTSALRSQLRSGSSARDLLWLGDVVLPAARTFEQLARAVGVRFESDIESELPAVRASELEAREALSNVLDNALRYGTGVIALTLEAVSAPSAGGEGTASSRREGGVAGEGADALPEVEAVRLAVWNSGPGVPARELARIFEPGFRGANALDGRARGGSGLGLSITRELVTALGGVVSLRNERAPSWLGERGCGLAPEVLEQGTLVEILLPRALIA